MDGLIPVLALLSATENVPNPINDTLSPSWRAFVTVETKASTAFFASTLLKPASAATALIRSEERRGGEECRSRWSPDQ